MFDFGFYHFFRSGVMPLDLPKTKKYLFTFDTFFHFCCKTYLYFVFIRPSRDGPYYVIGYGEHPHRFPHNNFSYVYRIFTKHGHMIPQWKGKNHIYFGVIRSKVKVTITINRISDNRVVST